ncbi:MAG TPA: hypothetical protein PKY82_17640 [Pyrinomonadaceae bacterium]|nr:hypothetical protein [Pyrinomonadaceae bacterium]
MKKYIVSILLIGLFSTFSTAVLAQGKGNRRNTQPTDKPAKNTVQRNNAPNTPPKSDGMVYQKITPCNQMNDDAGIAKNRQCKLPNGQITTIGKFCDDFPNESVCRQNTANGNGRGGRNNRQTVAGQNQVTGGTIPVYARNQQNENRQNGDSAEFVSKIDLPTLKGKGKRQNGNTQANNSTKPNDGFAGTTMEGTDVTRTDAPIKPLNKPRRGNGRNAPANTNGETDTPTNQNSQSASQGKTNNAGLQETKYDFIYPTQPSDIVTWNENSGPYGYTTANSGWEFIQTSAGIAVRRRGQEGTVVAHTKCNDTANYSFGYGGNNGSIDMIMCRPLHDGLPRLKPSIMIVPKSQQ